MNIQFMFYKNLKIGQICTATYPSKVGMIGSMIQAGWVTKISDFFSTGGHIGKPEITPFKRKACS